MLNNIDFKSDASIEVLFGQNQKSIRLCLKYWAICTILLLWQ